MDRPRDSPYSGRMSETRQRILDTARILFNDRGLHRVGVREIARAVGISPGNLSYHFKTKDDLVSALVLELHEWARTVFTGLPAEFSFVTLYRTAITVMHNTLRYRFVLLSYVDAVMASPELQRLEATLQITRRQRTHLMLGLLARNGFVHAEAIAKAPYLHEISAMISSGWLNAAALDPIRRDDEAVVLHYAKIGCSLLEPYCTPAGALQMHEILAGQHDRPQASLA
jgi:AcrR family transcriptional regulator